GLEVKDHRAAVGYTPKVPLLDGHPYLYLGFDTDFSAGFGGFQFPSFTGPVPAIQAAVVIDPTDWMVYAGVGGIPDVGGVAMAFSQNGQIPYEANVPLPGD